MKLEIRQPSTAAVMCLVFIVLALVVLILWSIIQKSPRKISYVCLEGKTALVTGAARGIGYYTALGLASRGCRVIIVDVLDAEETKNSIVRKTNNTNIIFKQMDLADLESVRKGAKEICETEKRLDILINNAGVGARDSKKTKDGLDLVMQVNYFGPFLLTHLLAELLKKSAPSRIIFVSSILSCCGKVDVETLNGNIKDKLFSISLGAQLYANSKTCAVIAADGFSERLQKFNVTSIPVRPAFASHTRIFEESDDALLHVFSWKLNPWPFLLTLFAQHPSETAEHIVYTSVAQELEGVTEKFFSNSRECWKPWIARNKEVCDSIWTATEKLVELKPNEKLL